MSIDTKHPQYIERAPDWEQMRDTYAGERAVKAKGEMYLPPTSGMREDGYPRANTAGANNYNAYRTRARCPDLVDEAASALLGVMHSKPPVITLPAKMEYLRVRASERGESLERLLQRINFEQMVVGRLGLLGDLVDSGPRDGKFYIASYTAETIINWDVAVRTDLEVEALNMVVLDESGQKRTPGEFEWTVERRFRILALGDLVEPVPAGGSATYRAATIEDSVDFNPANLVAPMYQGREAREIPFVFVNAEDIASEPGKPPLLGLSNLTLTIYRGEADYRQSLFMQGQDTLVQIGVMKDVGGEDDRPTRIGVGAVLEIPDPSGDAKFIGVDSKGLPEQRNALAADYGRGEQFAGRLMDSVTRERESGDALRIRLATRTATLNQIAKAGAYGLEMILKKIARWMGEDPEAVSVVPNLDFVDDQMTGQQLDALMTAKEKGAPVSLQTIHEVMSTRSMTKMSFEEEMKAIRSEKALLEEIRPDPPAPAGSPPPAGGGGPPTP